MTLDFVIRPIGGFVCADHDTDAQQILREGRSAKL